MILDGLKALVPVLILRLADPDGAGFAVMAAAVMVGHVWPIWWRFRGGRGQAVLLGALIVIDVLSIPVIILAGAAIGLLAFTSVYMARQIWPVPLTLWFWVVEGVGPEFWFAVAAGLVYVLASLGDFREEYRVRQIRGISEYSYWKRLRDAWRRFFREDD